MGMSKHGTTHSFGQTLLDCFVGTEVFFTKDGFLIDRHGIVLTTMLNFKEDYLRLLKVPGLTICGCKTCDNHVFLMDFTFSENMLILAPSSS